MIYSAAIKDRLNKFRQWLLVNLLCEAISEFVFIYMPRNLLLIVVILVLNQVSKEINSPIFVIKIGAINICLWAYLLNIQEENKDDNVFRQCSLVNNFEKK